MVLVKEVSHPAQKLLELLRVPGTDVVNVGLEFFDLRVDLVSGKCHLAFVATPFLKRKFLYSI